MKFPGVGLGEDLTKEKRQICIDNLMKHMMNKYNSVNKVKSYVLGKINSIIKRKGIKVSELSRICFMGDFCDGKEKPKDYLESVLNGKKSLQYPILDRLAMQFNLRNERFFPFEKEGSKPVTVAEYVLFPVA